MDNSNFENNILEKSQFLQASIIFQYIFAIMGINLPPLLNGSQGTNGWQKRHINCIWVWFILHSILRIALVVWIVYINNMVVDMVVYNYDLDSITSVLSVTVNITVALVQLIMQMMIFLKHNSIRILLRKIAQLERDILLYHREYEWLQNEVNLNKTINFPKRCQRFRRIVLYGFGLYAVVFSSLFCYANYHVITDIMHPKDKIMTLFCMLALQMKSLEFCIAVQIIFEFIAALQNFLSCITYEIAQSKGKPFTRLIFHRKLMANQLLINRIWLLVTAIEEHYGISMMSLYLYNGVAITYTINWSYVSSFAYLGQQPVGMFRLIYIILLFFHMLMPCWLTQSCIDKYKQFGSILHNFKTSDDLALNFRMREYSLQLRHQEMLFTCCGFFDINLKYFGLIILSISTYVAILIQFKLQKETEKATAIRL